MDAPDKRLTAVIAALEALRDHIHDLDDDDPVDAGAYNRWIAMLEGVVEGNWKSLQLDEGTLPASECLMTIDAAIAFLTVHQDA